ncbi:MAG: glutathione S-transferase family protein [Ramlibacter sp.]
MLKLISATPSPYARKVRIALAEKGIPFELLTEVPWHSTTVTPRYNPLEKLPVLLLPDGSSVYESSYILQYLELKHPQVPLLPHDIDDKLAALKLQVLCDGVCDAVVLTLFERRREGGGSPEWLARQRRKIDGGVAAMARLVDSKVWAVGDRFTLGDIAVGTVAGYLSVRLAELRWRELYPEMAVFCDRLEQRPSFKDSVPYAQSITEKVV